MKIEQFITANGDLETTSERTMIAEADAKHFGYYASTDQFVVGCRVKRIKKRGRGYARMPDGEAIFEWVHTLVTIPADVIETLLQQRDFVRAQAESDGVE